MTGRGAGESYGVCAPEGGKLLMMGGSGATFTFADRPGQVSKLPYHQAAPTANVEVEKRIYKRLGSHPNIIPCLGIDADAIHLELAEHGCLRLYFREGGTATTEERVRWARDLAGVIQYLHDHNVRQVDIGGRNILLDAERNIRLCDFAGSSIDDVAPTVVAQDGFRHPDDDEALRGTLRAEIHAIGSTIYEIMTSTCPHRREEEEEVGRALDLMRAGVYPDVAGVVLGRVIAACWRGEYASAREVAEGIKKEQEEIFKVAQPST
ncbi:kinase-like domain-containing protein [Cercophora scortea]|uniref:Kinase-like domain-containing protein n=1 Tax=Cercophora scortea TaxID=314031 RepID=A0AAE0I8N9_9PEZI|nr:kinase-like domain-containing protein [Cercophora scortea]